jgi:hypothetical protein
MNFDMAAEMADMDDIRVETVLVTDDVASAPRSNWTHRGVIAGMFFAYKVAVPPPRRAWTWTAWYASPRRRGEHGDHGRGAFAVHRAGGGRAPLHDWRRRDGDRMGIHGGAGVMRGSWRVPIRSAIA